MGFVYFSFKWRYYTDTDIGVKCSTFHYLGHTENYITSTKVEYPEVVQI